MSVPSRTRSQSGLHAIAGVSRELNERRRAWLDPEGASDAELKQQTLAHLHTALDRAVWAWYGWENDDPRAVTEDAIPARLRPLNESWRTG